MARIDRFIQAFFDRHAQGLVLAPGKPAALLTDAGPQPATREPLTPAQYLPLLKEIAPLAEQGRLDGLLPVTFTYASPAGLVSIEVIPEPDGRSPGPTRVRRLSLSTDRGRHRHSGGPQCGRGLRHRRDGRRGLLLLT